MSNEVVTLTLKKSQMTIISKQKLRVDKVYVICFGKPTKLSHLVFQEIPILNIETTVVFLC